MDEWTETAAREISATDTVKGAVYWQNYWNWRIHRKLKSGSGKESFWFW
jgi:hypothetical protein